MSRLKLEFFLKPFFGTDFNKLSNFFIPAYSHIDPSNMQSLEREIIPYWVDWLAQLNVDEICQKLHDNLIKQVRASEFKGYFNGDMIYTIADTDTTTVATIKEILLSLKTVIEIFDELNRLKLDPSQPMTAGLIQCVTNLLKKIDPLFHALKTLSHSVVGVEAMIAPLLAPLMDVIGNMPQQMDHAQNYVLALQCNNQEALKNMFSKQHYGLRLLSRTIVLSPYLFKELTELIERGDQKIDFDPLNPIIINMEDRINQKLNRIQKATRSDPLDEANYWKNVFSLLGLLLTELNVILKEAAPLTQASHQRASKVLDLIHHQVLPYLHGEMERLEEHAGMKNRFVEPFLKSVEDWYQTIGQKLDTLGTLAETSLSAQAFLKQPMKGAINKFSQALVTPSSSPQEKTDVQHNLFLDTHYQQKITELRQQRFATYNAKHDQLYGPVLEKACDFFETVEKIKAQPLSEKDRFKLSNAYKKFQPYLVKKFPKLDVEIVKNLQYEWSFYQMPLWDTERYIAENNFNPTEYFSLKDLGNTISYVKKDRTIKLDFTTNHHEEFTSQSLSTISQLEKNAPEAKRPKEHLVLRAQHIHALFGYTMPAPTLDHTQIASSKDIVLKEIKRAANEAAFHAKQTSCTTTQLIIQDQAKASISAQQEKTDAAELKPLGNEFYHQDLFARLHELKLSKSLRTFEDAILAPWIQSLVQPSTWQAINYSAEKHNRINYKDAPQVVPHKRLLSLMFQLRACLEQLEQLEQLEELDDLENHTANQLACNNGVLSTIGRVVSYFNQESPGKVKYIQGILLPILKDGIGAYFELLELIKNPLFQDIRQEFLTKLAPLKEFEFFLKLLNLSANSPLAEPTLPPAEPSNLFETWQKAEALRDDRIQKRAPEIPTPPPQQLSVTDSADAVSIEEIEAKDPLPNLSNLVTWINQQSLKIIAYQQKLQDKTTEVSQKNAEQITADFFAVIKAKSNEILNRSQRPPPDHDSWVDRAAELSLESEKINLFLSAGNASVQEWLKKSLSFVENLGAIINELSTAHKATLIASLQCLHHVLQYELLSLLDDAEIKLGLKPGILNQQYQLTTMIDRAFDRLVVPSPQNGETLQPFLDFFADQEVTTWRKKKLEQQLHPLVTKNPGFLLAIENKQIDIAAALDGLKTLDTQLRRDSSQKINWNYAEARQHKQTFCDYYEVLQPYLSQIKPDLYTKNTGFFDLLTTPRQLNDQLKKLLELRTELELNELLETQKKDLEYQYKCTEQHLKEVENNLSKQHQKHLLEQCIHKIIKEKYPLHDYTPLYIKVVTPIIFQQIQKKPSLLAKIIELVFEKNSIELASVLEIEISSVSIAHKDSLGLFIKTLSSLSELESRLKKQYDTTWDKISHEKPEYKLSLYQEKKARSPNKIYFELIGEDPNHEIKYYVGDHQGTLDQEQLRAFSIDFSTQKKPISLTRKILKTQFEPKINDILAITHQRGHSRPKNPCFHELMDYLKRIKPADNQAALLNEQFENQGYKIDVSSNNLSLTDHECKPNTLYVFLSDQKELHYSVKCHGQVAKGKFNRAELNKLNLSRLTNPLASKEISAQLQSALPNILQITAERKHTTQLMEDLGRHRHFYRRLYISHALIKNLSYKSQQKSIDRLQTMADIYNILNNLQQHVLQQLRPNQKKLHMISDLQKIISDSNLPPKQRMQTLLANFNNQAFKIAFTTSSDSFIARCCKKIVSLITRQPFNEESYTRKLCEELKKYDNNLNLSFSFFQKKSPNNQGNFSASEIVRTNLKQ
jgi:hypothetical protein